MITDQELVASGMTQEVDRCRAGLQRARDGAVVAIVSSGDAGVYGMAGLALEMALVPVLALEMAPGLVPAEHNSRKPMHPASGLPIP